MPPHHHHHEELPVSILDAIDQLEQLLGDTRTMRRLSSFAFEEGPYHHRATSGVLSAVLLLLVERFAADSGRSVVPYRGPVEECELEVPPHLRHRSRKKRGELTVGIPTRLVKMISADRNEFDELVEALADGPAHEVAVNAITLQLLETLYDSISGGARKWAEQDDA